MGEVVVAATTIAAPHETIQDHHLRDISDQDRSLRGTLTLTSLPEVMAEGMSDVIGRGRALLAGLLGLLLLLKGDEYPHAAHPIHLTVLDLDGTTTGEEATRLAPEIDHLGDVPEKALDPRPDDHLVTDATTLDAARDLGQGTTDQEAVAKLLDLAVDIPVHLLSIERMYALILTRTNDPRFTETSPQTTRT